MDLSENAAAKIPDVFLHVLTLFGAFRKDYSYPRHALLLCLVQRPFYSTLALAFQEPNASGA